MASAASVSGIRAGRRIDVRVLPRDEAFALPDIIRTATNLVPALANNSEWASLGGGTYTPLCLSWLVTANNTYTLYYIKLSLVTHDWSEITSAELSTC